MIIYNSLFVSTKRSVMLNFPLFSRNFDWKLFLLVSSHQSGKLWWRIGWVILVPSIIIYLPFYGALDDAVGIVGLILTFIQIAALIGSIFPTEKALKRTFTEEGLRR